MAENDWRYGPMSCRCLTGAELEADSKLRKSRAEQKERIKNEQG